MSPQGLLCVILTIFGTFENIRGQACGPTQCTADGYFDSDLTLSPDKNCFDDGEQVSLACSGDLGGPPFNNCNNGNWDFPSATCEVFTCSRPVTGDSLNVVPDKQTYNAREFVTYNCDQGTTLVGTTTATCDSQDTWNPATVPVCTVSCEIPNIVNGNLTTDGPFNEGDSAEVSCYTGSDLEAGSSSTITCQSDGTWDSVPQCLRRCTVKGVENSNNENDQEISHGSTRTINCINGYSYDQTTSFTVSCSDGQLSGEVPDQCFQDCVPLSAPENGEVIGGNLHEQSVEFVCDRGYGFNATANTTDTCTDGSWVYGVTPTCYELSLSNSISLYCNPDKFIVEIPGGLLGDNVGVESVTLGSCQGSYYDGEYLYVNSSYTECETTAVVDEFMEQIVYSNTVLSAVSTEEVTTQEALTINVECVFDQENVVSSSAVVQNSLSKNLEGSGQFEMVFAAYSDDKYTTEITGDVRVNTNDVIYLRAEVNYISLIDVFPTRCYATPEPDANYFRYFELITEGCPTSTYVSNLQTQASTKQNFAFDMNVFRFTDSDSDSIYIHCELKICPESDEDTSCALPGNCQEPSRRKRATRISFSRHVSAGPIRINSEARTGESSSGAWQSTALTVYSATVSLVLLCVVGVVGVIGYRRRTRVRDGYRRPRRM